MEGYQSSVPGQQPARKTMMEVTYVLTDHDVISLFILFYRMHACMFCDAWVDPRVHTVDLRHARCPACASILGCMLYSLGPVNIQETTPGPISCVQS